MSAKARRVAVLERRYREAMQLPVDEWIHRLSDEDADFLTGIEDVEALSTDEYRRLMDMLQDMRAYVATRILEGNKHDRHR